MKKIKFFAAGLALTFAFCSAFTNVHKVKDSDDLYGVTGTDGSNYIVTDITGQTEGQQYICTESSTNCTVSANPDSVSNGEVPMSEATPQDQGTFQALQ